MTQQGEHDWQTQTQTPHVDFLKAGEEIAAQKPSGE